MYRFISIVVPAYNAETCLGRCIESLLALDYPKEKLEILVVDNASTDQTPTLISQYPVRGLREGTPGSTAARNRGVVCAQGDIIAFTDADCLVHTNWAREINRTFADPHVDAVMGFAAGMNANFWAGLEQGNFEAFWFRQEAQGYALKRLGIDTRNCAIRKAVLEACGYFNAELRDCEDLDLSVKMRARQCHLVFNDKMRVWHRNRTDLGHILRLKANHARAFMQIVEAQPDGFDCPELPCDYRTFLGVDNRSIRGVKLATALLGFRGLRGLIILALRGLAAVRAKPHGVALNLFKTVCCMTWEITILQAKREQGR